MLTDGSPASIFATRDWLDPRIRPNCSWVSFRFDRSSRTALARTSFRSTTASSSAVSPRNSLADPSFQPAFSRRFLFWALIASSLPGRPDRTPRDASGSARSRSAGLLGLLLEDITDHDRVHVDPVDDPPLVLLVSDSQLMAAFPDGRHRPRIRQGRRLAVLDSSQQNARFDPRLLRERWCLDLAVKACERLSALMLCQT